MYVSSDASGEIYIVAKDEAANGTEGSSSSGGGSSGSSSGGKPKSGGARGRGVVGTGALVLLALLACCVAL